MNISFRIILEILINLKYSSIVKLGTEPHRELLATLCFKTRKTETKEMSQCEISEAK
jgi:hypothetical protein